MTPDRSEPDAGRPVDVYVGHDNRRIDMWRLIFLPFFAVAEIAALLALWVYAVFEPEHAEQSIMRIPERFPDFGWYLGK